MNKFPEIQTKVDNSRVDTGKWMDRIIDGTAFGNKVGICPECKSMGRIYGSGLCGECTDEHIKRNGGEDRT